MQGAGFISKKALQIIAVCDIISGYLRRSADMPHKYGIAGMMELADVPDSKSGGSDTVRVRPPLPAPVKALVSASAFRLFGISYIRRWRSWITQQIPILKNGGSNPFRRAKSKTSQNHAFLRCKGRFIVLIFCQKMSGNNRKNLNYICIMQTRCRYEIFLVCFFVVKTTRVRL